MAETLDEWMFRNRTSLMTTTTTTIRSEGGPWVPPRPGVGTPHSQTTQRSIQDAPIGGIVWKAG